MPTAVQMRGGNNRDRATATRVQPRPHVRCGLAAPRRSLRTISWHLVARATRVQRRACSTVARSDQSRRCQRPPLCSRLSDVRDSLMTSDHSAGLPINTVRCLSRCSAPAG